MNKELILKSDVLDILFENRNKSYGAYNLRKFYGNRLMKATGAMIAVVVVLSAFTFLPEKKVYETRTYTIPDDPTLGHVKPPENKPPEVKPKTTVVPLKAAASAVFVSNIKIVPRNTLTDTIVDITSLAISSVKTPPGNTGGPQIIIPPDSNNGGGDKTAATKPVVDKTTPVYTAEVMPSFPGGYDALRKFLERNLHNPRDMEEGEQVSVKMQFVVGYDGKLQSFNLVQDGGELFDKEVTRVLKKMPDWVPGKSNGENVSVYYVIPIKFVSAE